MNEGRLRQASVPWLALVLVLVAALVLDLVGIGGGCHSSITRMNRRTSWPSGTWSVSGP